MTQKEYLNRNFAEETPMWLESYSPGCGNPLGDFFKSRIFFYPGSGTDGHPIRIFGGSHSVHCFLYVDQLVGSRIWERELHVRGLLGYRIVDEIDLSAREIASAVHNRQNHLEPEEMRRMTIASKRVSGILSRNGEKPCANMTIFEREPQFDDGHGAKRLAVLFLTADGFAVYDEIFACRNASEPFGILLEDYGVGTNYDRFGPDGLCERIARRSGVFPEFILARSVPWEGYERVADVEDSVENWFHDPRRLFRRV